MPSSLEIVRKFFPSVETVADGEQPVHVQVTRGDSNSSTVKNHKGCALAVACKRILKVDGVVISVKRAYLVSGNRAVRYQLPESASREVVSFDRQGGFAEGEYQLSVIPKKRSKKKKKARFPREDNNYKAKFAHTTEGIRTALGSKNAV